MKKKPKALMGRMIQAVVRVTPETDAKITEIAKRECRSYSSVLRQAIAEFLKRHRA